MSIKLILHPGYNKCGSTSIQRYIHLNADLIEQQGFYISDINFRFTFDTPKLLIRRASPFFYFERMMQNQDFLKFEKRIESVIRSAKHTNCKAIIITAEGLGNNPGRKRGKAIHEILSSYFDDVSVLIYIRRQDDYLLSSWQQWGHRQGESLEEHVEYALQSSDYSPDYLDTAQYFREFYGEQSVQVVPLVRKALSQGDLGLDFCDRAKIGTSSLRQVGDHVNIGLNPSVCDILSRCSEVYEHVHDNSVKAVLEKYASNNNVLYKKNKAFLSYDCRQQIMQHYAQENRVLQSTYFSHIPYEEVFEPPKDKAPTEDSISDVEELKDIISLQMNLLLLLLKENQKQKLTIKKRIRLLLEKIAALLYS